MEALVTESRTEGFGLEVRRRILLGAFVLSVGHAEAYTEQAQRVRTLVRQDFDAALSTCDVLLAPVAPGLPPKLGAVVDPLEAYLGDVQTVGASLAGLPALSVPARTPHPSGLPVGVQLIGRAFDEATVLRVGAAVERG